MTELLASVVGLVLGASGTVLCWEVARSLLKL